MKRNVGATKRIVTTALVLGATGSAAGCLRVNDGHCMFHGGDNACDPGRYCVAAAGTEIPSADPNGCSEQRPDLTDASIAYLKYGVLDDAEHEALRLELGIYIDCPQWPPMTDPLRRIEEYLRAQEREKKVSRDSAMLDSKQGGEINRLTEEISHAAAACGGGATTGTTSGTGDTDTSSDTISTGSSTTNDELCMDDTMCSGDTPFCKLETMTCVACIEMPESHAACAGMNDDTPVCLEGKGCVQCTAEMPDACTGATPVCDAETNLCSPCTAHEPCGQAACNFFTGACLPGDQVAHVGPGQTYATLTAGVASINGSQGTIVVHGSPFDDYNESVTVDDGQAIAFLAEEIGPGADPPLWVRTAGNTPQLTVNAGGTVLLDGMQLSGNQSTMAPGLLVDGGQAWLDRSRVVANLGGGIRVQAEGELVLRNCFMDGDVNDRHTLEVSDATALALYTTFGAGFGTSAALVCNAASTVTVRNSLLVSRSTDPEIVCANATLEHNATEMLLGGTNTDLPDMSTNWFVNYGAGDFHLAATAPAAIDTAARWRLGDPPTDIDSDPRPTAGDTPDVAGADVP